MMLEFVGYIYIVENLINGKIYVGQTIAPDKRKYSHFSTGKSAKSIVNKSIEKHGKENFDFVLLECCSSKEELDRREEYWIENLNSLANIGYGYNRTPHAYGGNKGMLGKKHSPETLEKMSQERKGRKVHTPEWKEQMSLRMSGENHPLFGKKFSQDSRHKMREAHRNVPLTEQHKQSISEAHMGSKNPFFGKKHTEETRKKMKHSAKLRPKTIISKETRMKMVETRKSRGWNIRFRGEDPDKGDA